MNVSQLNNISESSTFKSDYFRQMLLLVFVAILVWTIFYPGLFSNDSANQYGQAANGKFTNWHPPLMAIILSMILNLGGNIGILVLFQCLAAILAIKSFSRQILINFFSLSSKSTEGITTFISIFLLIPISPFLFYTVTFWKDIWLTILLLWIGTYFIWLMNNSNKIKKTKALFHLFLITCLSSPIILIRHNSIVMLPIIGILLFVLICNIFPLHFYKLKLIILALPIIFAPIILSLLLQLIITQTFNVKDLHAERGVQQTDLSLLLKTYPELAGEFPITARHLNSPKVLFSRDDGSHFAMWDDSIEGQECPQIKRFPDPVSFDWDNLDPIYENTSPPPCYSYVSEENPSLKKEYWSAIQKYPVRIFKIKLHQFLIVLTPKLSLSYTITKDVDDPTLGTNKNFKELRNYLYSFFEYTKDNSYLLYGLNIHALWFLIAIAVFFKFLVDSIRQKAKIESLFRCILVLLPISYDLSYFLAVAGTDYRYMYPATLFIQILMFSLISVKTLFFFKNRKTLTNFQSKASLC